ncbi:unnamed protein product [Rotaria sp. Silwood2]|nr:unnamed protein product [Rotaria sp. Silwood2]CAF3336198.1 unnamed protein product [Rotaria sp. Silwood2]CAF4099783.1 unnamed protein product [Rotaria sp. Silwood2]CAF4249542.1 unnamed protein product [Rotaria sp. Silwood2]
MADSINDENNSTVASTTVISTDLILFVYENLFNYIQAIQHQMIDITKYLDKRCKNEKTYETKLKSRSIMFVDSYENRITNEYMNHELISTLII